MIITVFFKQKHRTKYGSHMFPIENRCLQEPCSRRVLAMIIIIFYFCYKAVRKIQTEYFSGKQPHHWFFHVLWKIDLFFRKKMFFFRSAKCLLTDISNFFVFIVFFFFLFFFKPHFGSFENETTLSCFFLNHTLVPFYEGIFTHNTYSPLISQFL